MEASASLSNIPNHIIPHILLHLPVKSLIRFQCVCKSWRLLIQDDSDFKLSYRGQGRVIILSQESKVGKYRNSKFKVRSTSHDLRLQRHKWPFGEVYPLIRDSNLSDVKLCYCNGLVLLADKGYFLLWNPSTCSTKVFQGPYKYLDIALVGLCYDSCTRDYKVVLLHSCGFGPASVIFARLNRKKAHKKWRTVEFPYCPDAMRGGVNFRNTFHWWGVSDGIKYQRRNFLSLGNKIIYFDPVCDGFRILPTPDELRQGRENLIVGLGVIDDCFCMAHLEEEEHNSTKTNKIKVLIMKEYGRQESWMTVFAFQMCERIDVFGRDDLTLTFYSLKNDAQEIVFLSSSDCSGQVYVYDPKKEELKDDQIDFLIPYRRYLVSMCFYVESFALPVPQ